MTTELSARPRVETSLPFNPVFYACWSSMRIGNARMSGPPASQPTIATISRKRAAGLACLVVYGPFVVMASYALLLESSSYVQATAWILLPWAPGIIPVEAGRQLLGLPRLSDTITFILALMVSTATIVVLSWLVRKSRWLRCTSLAVALVLFSISALSILQMLRS